MNGAGHFFTVERLVTGLASFTEHPAKSIVEGTIGDVRRFSDGVQQSDDITVVALRYCGP
jgi:serine phosphatase RsbU (regulator of sigma subunit)